MINYYLLTKPGIILGNLATIAAGFILGSQGTFDIPLFLATLLGLTFIIGSACVFNNYIDRAVDEKMERTKKRALAQGLIKGRNALIFGTLLGLIGNSILLGFTNLLSFALANLAFFVYVLLYSLWKCRTVYGTAIGSIAGALPPVIGYCAASNQLDGAALILFAIMILWQMPHFFSIALFHLEDYSQAGIPVLPLVKGIQRTKLQMLIYVMAFIPVTFLLTLFGYTGQIYLLVSASFGFTWLLLCIYGLTADVNHFKWGKQMFMLSLVVISALCLIIPFDRITI